MDIKQIRQANLRELVRSMAGGKQVVFAELTGLAPSFISQLLMHPSKPRHRNMGHSVARNIEKALGLSIDSMDSPDSFKSKDPIFEEIPEGQAALNRIREMYEEGLLSDADILMIETLADRMINTQ